MRVVQVLGRAEGGIAAHVRDLTEQLREAGDRVVVLGAAASLAALGPQPAGAAVSAWPADRPWGALSAARRLRQSAATSDVVHAHGLQAGAWAAAVLSTCVAHRAGGRTPLVVSLHNDLPSGTANARLGRALFALIGRRAGLVTGASSDLVAWARAHASVPAELAPVPSPRVPNLLARARASNSARAEAAARLVSTSSPPGTRAADPGPALLVVTIARLAPQKDLDTLVRAAAELARAGATPSLTWAVVGGGDERVAQRLRRLAGELGAPVRLVGACSDPEAWLRAADVFVLTSRWEARALVVQEALAAGVPVVATHVGGLPDLLADVGELVDVGDHHAVAAAVGRYLADPQLRHAASVAGRRRAASWDDSPGMARRWRVRYDRLISMT